MNIFSEQGWLAAWNIFVAGNGLARIRLYQNNHIPAFTDTVADYVEATFSGYFGFQNLVWGAAFINGSNQGEIDAAMLTWTHNGGGIANLCYGIYVTNAADVLTYGERFDAAVSMAALGDMIRYTPIATVINQ